MFIVWVWYKLLVFFRFELVLLSKYYFLMIKMESWFDNILIELSLIFKLVFVLY